MKRYKNLKEVQKACGEVRSCMTQSDKFMYRCFPLLLELLIGINEKLSRPKREPSAYNLHIAREMKAGKTMAEAAASYKKSSPT